MAGGVEALPGSAWQMPRGSDGVLESAPRYFLLVSDPLIERIGPADAPTVVHPALPRAVPAPVTAFAHPAGCGSPVCRQAPWVPLPLEDDLTGLREFFSQKEADNISPDQSSCAGPLVRGSSPGVA
ncbi:hypothetical protein GCM10010343_58790 [Streptomyces avidinii]|nr:hypothetical protein GCM10010343_58790 [Streptomyces avidinii]